MSTVQRQEVHDAAYGNLFTADSLVQYQIEQIHRSRFLSPEKGLMVAVLADAVEWLHEHDIAPVKHYRVFEEALDWLLRQNDGIFSFEGICEHLGLDAEAVRSALMPKIKSRKKEIKKINFYIF